MSGNHNQKYDQALKIIDAAARAGADAIKLQTYTADTLTIDCDNKYFQVNTNNAWKGQGLYGLYKKAYTPWEWQPKLKKYAESKGLVCFSTPFDDTAVDFLEKINVPMYKIAGYEFVHIPLLKKVASTKKPVIVSVGYPSLQEINLCVTTLMKNGAGGIAVLHCSTTYLKNPNLEDLKLGMIKDIAKKFNVVTGFSDNNAGIEGPIMAVVAGASIIEKHLTLKRSDGGPDADFSIEPDELKEMTAKIRQIEKSFSSVNYAKKSEGYYKQLHPTIFAVKNIKKGEQFTSDNTRVIRPGYGLESKYYFKVLDKTSKKEIKRGTPLKKQYIRRFGR